MFPMSMDTENHVFTGGELKKKKKVWLCKLVTHSAIHRQVSQQYLNICEYPSNT